MRTSLASPEYYYYNGIGSNGGGLFTARELKILAVKNNSLFNPPFISVNQLKDAEIADALGAYPLVPPN